MTEPTEDALREVLGAAGAAKLAEITTPDPAWVLLEPGTDVPATPARGAGSGLRRSRRLWVSSGLVLAAAVALLILALPSDDSPPGRNLDVSSGRAGSTTIAAPPSTARPPTGAAVTAGAGSVQSTTAVSTGSGPGTTATTAGPSPSTTANGVTTVPTMATTAPPEPLAHWTDPGDRTGLIRCDAALAARSVGGDTCNRPVPEALYRPLSFPHLAPGAPCPVSTATSTPLPGSSQVFVGTGPVRLFSVDGPGVVRFGASNQRFWDAYWGGQKVLFALAPGLSGALVRGRRLDGTAAMGFGNVFDRGDAAVDELHLGSNPGSTWDTDVTSLRIRAPGCYGLQIDDASGSTFIVFSAVGPDLGPPPPMPPA